MPFAFRRRSGFGRAFGRRLTRRRTGFRRKFTSNAARAGPRARLPQRFAAGRVTGRIYNMTNMHKNMFAGVVSPSPMPREQVLWFRWYDMLGTPVTGTAGVYGGEIVYQMHSPFQPVFSGSGNASQPYGWDQLYTQWYGRYKVIGFSYEIRILTSSEDNMMIAVCLSDSRDGQTMNGKNIDEIGMRPHVTQIYAGLNSTQTTPPVFKGYVDLATLEGLTRQQYDADDTLYVGVGNANPTATAYIRIAGASVTGSSNKSCTIECKIGYKVQLMGLQGQAISS